MQGRAPTRRIIGTSKPVQVRSALVTAVRVRALDRRVLDRAVHPLGPSGVTPKGADDRPLHDGEHRGACLLGSNPGIHCPRPLAPRLHRRADTGAPGQHPYALLTALGSRHGLPRRCGTSKKNPTHCASLAGWRSTVSPHRGTKHRIGLFAIGTPAKITDHFVLWNANAEVHGKCFMRFGTIFAIKATGDHFNDRSWHDWRVRLCNF